MKYSMFPVIASLLVLTSSCSWYRNFERSLVDDEKKEAKTNNRRRPVPREQYDQLLVKYEELSKKYELLKENKPASESSSLVDELSKTQSENFANTSPNVETETVDVFAAANQNTNTVTSAAPVVPESLEAQLELYRRGLNLKANNPGEATKIFQQLEISGEPSVQVRSKFQIGELLYSRQQYDLALQVFEDIITKNAHSGVVVDALKFAAVCSDKLGIVAKRDQYTSMLNDVFEVR